MIILSGIQPSGALHVGNYFGMMCPSIELQDQGESYYFIADYHQGFWNAKWTITPTTKSGFTSAAN